MTIHRRLPPLSDDSEPSLTSSDLEVSRLLEQERTRRESNPAGNPLPPQPDPIPTVESPQVNPFDLISDLNHKDAKFVRAYLETGDLTTACQRGEYSTDSLTGARKLADPVISRVIISCAAFVGDTKRAMRIMTPYLLARLSNVAVTGRDAQALSAIRDALTVSGEGRDADAKDLRALIQSMRRERSVLKGNGGTPTTTDAVPRRLTDGDNDRT